jgi:hypothetical protein
MSKETYLHLKRELITERETLTQVASMAVEGMPAEEIDEFRGKLAHRMLHEFEHEGFSKKALKKQNKVRTCQKRPVYMSKETCVYVKRDLLTCQKRPAYGCCMSLNMRALVKRP